MNKKSLLKGAGCFLLILCTAASLRAQEDELLESIRKIYPDELAVYLNERETITLDIKGDSIEAHSEVYEEVLYLNDKANESFSQKKVYYSYFFGLEEISAETLLPKKNGKYTSVKVKNFETKDAFSSSVFYDDVKHKEFVFPSVQAGAKTRFNCKRKFADPKFLTSFYFGTYVPAMNSEFIVVANKNIQINYKFFNTDNIGLVFTKEEKGKYIVYKWVAKNIPSYTYEEQAPSYPYYRPHIVFYVESATINGQKQEVLSSVGDLYKWYVSLVQKKQEDECVPMKAVVDSLTKGTDDEIEKVKRIFYWVQDHIKYVAFEDAYRGYIPNKASLIFTNRYGDCKDMANIIHNMLRLAGIKSYLTWIGSRDLPYKYSEVNTPVVNDHMITTYENNGTYYFLDATSKYTPFGTPSSMIQGKQALIGLNEKEYKIMTVPVVEKSKNAFTDTAYFSISDSKTITGKGKASFRGYNKIYLTRALIGLNKEKEEKLVLNILEKGNNKFFVDEYTIQNIETRDVPLTINYEFNIKDYAKTIDGEIYVNLNLSDFFSSDKIDIAKRKYERENEFCFETTQLHVWEIPANYKIDYLPQNHQYDHEFFGFSVRYEQKNNQILQYKTIYLNYLLLGKKSFADWNNMVDAIDKSNKEVLILKKN